jgi:hypothetical protein
MRKKRKNATGREGEEGRRRQERESFSRDGLVNQSRSSARKIVVTAMADAYTQRVGVFMLYFLSLYIYPLYLHVYIYGLSVRPDSNIPGILLHCRPSAFSPRSVR